MNPYLAAALAEQQEIRKTQTSADKTPAKKAAESASKSDNPSPSEEN